MKHVYYDSKTPTSFEEHLEFNIDIPYTVRIKFFKTADIVPLHYAETLEILICENLKGAITIQNCLYKLDGNQVFLIPPYTVHSNKVYTCSGKMYVLKFSIDMLSKYLNIPALFSYNDRVLTSLSYTCPEYKSISSIVHNLIKNDDDFFLCIADIVKLFRILLDYTNCNINEEIAFHSLKGSDLHELINWTQKNFHKKISLEELANITGYTKHYFCHLFKSRTGCTYMTYLNSVRLSHASKLLLEGVSVSNIPHFCGFEDISYFIQQFKKIYGKTPKQYQKTNYKLL